MPIFSRDSMPLDETVHGAQNVQVADNYFHRFFADGNLEENLQAFFVQAKNERFVSPYLFVQFYEFCRNYNLHDEWQQFINIFGYNRKSFDDVMDALIHNGFSYSDALKTILDTSSYLNRWVFMLHFIKFSCVGFTHFVLDKFVYCHVLHSVISF